MLKSWFCLKSVYLFFNFEIKVAKSKGYLFLKVRKENDKDGKEKEIKIVEELTENRNKRKHYICICDCGNKIIVSANNLRSGAVKSCGCLHKKNIKKTHGKTGSSEFNIWKTIKQRTLNSNNDNFGFFDNDLNEQRDSKSKAYGIFADDEIDEVHKNYGFFDEDLETISNNTKDDDFKTSDKEKEDFGFFLMDAQSSLIEDYLKYCPSDEERLKKLISEKKFLTGPWNTQTDQLVISQESVVRNLYYGIDYADKMGHSMPIGYAPDIFGQGGNMPQIYRHFDIHKFLFVFALHHLDEVFLPLFS